MDTRHLIAYVVMTIIVLASIALGAVVVRNRRRERDMWRGKHRRHRR